MKFLKDEEIVIEKGLIKVTMNPVTTSIQARLMDFSIGVQSIERTTERSRYVLRCLVKELEIDGKAYDPIKMADKIDLSDKTSQEIFIEVGQIVTNSAFMGEEDGKKSEPPLKHGSLGGGVKNVPGQSMEDNPDKDA